LGCWAKARTCPVGAVFAPRLNAVSSVPPGLRMATWLTDVGVADPLACSAVKDPPMRMSWFDRTVTESTSWFALGVNEPSIVPSAFTRPT